MSADSYISVIVPVYKVEKYLERCVNSILNQTYDKFELILVDDGSPDQCGAMCDQIAEKWNQKNHCSQVIVIHQENGGLSAARNAGIDWFFAYSKSEWITFIDSDDWIHQDYLKHLYQAAINTGCKISIGCHTRTSEYKQMQCSTDLVVPRVIDTEEYWREDRTNATTAWGKLYKKELLESIRYPLQKLHEDEFVTYRILFQEEKIAIVDEVIYFYYFNQESISRLDYMKRYPYLKEVFAEQYQYFKDTRYQKAFAEAAYKYTDTLSEAIWFLRKHREYQDSYDIEEIRKELCSFLKKNQSMIPYEDNKAFYIAAYPKHELFIRGFGFVKVRLKKIRNRI